MSQKPDSAKPSSERRVKDIRPATRRQYSAEKKFRNVLDGARGFDGARGEHNIAELCRREGIAESHGLNTGFEASLHPSGAGRS